MPDETCPIVCWIKWTCYRSPCVRKGRLRFRWNLPGAMSFTAGSDSCSASFPEGQTANFVALGGLARSRHMRASPLRVYAQACVARGLISGLPAELPCIPGGVGLWRLSIRGVQAWRAARMAPVSLSTVLTLSASQSISSRLMIRGGENWISGPPPCWSTAARQSTPADSSAGAR